MAGAFDRAVRSLAECWGFRMEDTGTDIALISLSMDEIAGEIAFANLRSFMGSLLNVGVGVFQRYLEIKHFRPGTARNALLHAYVLRWQNVAWSVTAFPAAELSEVELALALTYAELCVSPEFYVKMEEGEALADGTLPAAHPAFFAGGWVVPDFRGGEPLYICSRPDSAFDGAGGLRAQSLWASKMDALEREFQDGLTA